MKRMMLAAAAVAGLAMTAKADFGGPQAPPAGYPGQPAGEGCSTCDKYGTHPLLRKLMWWKTDGAGKASTGSIKPPAPQSPPGTLVFPYHQYNRGPRDFFMWEPGR